MNEIVDALDALSTDALRLLYRRAVRGSNDGMLGMFFLAEHPQNILLAEAAAEFKPLIAYIAFHAGISMDEATTRFEHSLGTLMRMDVKAVTQPDTGISIIPVAGVRGHTQSVTDFHNTEQGMSAGLPVTIIHEILHQLFDDAGLDDNGKWWESEGHAFIHGLARGLYRGIGADDTDEHMLASEKRNIRIEHIRRAYETGDQILVDTRAANRALRSYRDRTLRSDR